VIDHHRTTLAHRLRSDRTVLGPHAQAGEALRHFAVGLFSDKFVNRVRPPKVNARDVKEVTCCTAEVLDQGAWLSAFSRSGTKSKQELLEIVVAFCKQRGMVLGKNGTAARDVNS
jgi:hypothetical protein